MLKTQKGNCFEYANLLASLLIGVGYDAYCVCGYATQDVTLLNQIRKPCPQLAKGEQVASQPQMLLAYIHVHYKQYIKISD